MNAHHTTGSGHAQQHPPTPYHASAAGQIPPEAALVQLMRLTRGRLVSAAVEKTEREYPGLTRLMAAGRYIVLGLFNVRRFHDARPPDWPSVLVRFEPYPPSEFDQQAAIADEPEPPALVCVYVDPDSGSLEANIECRWEIPSAHYRGNSRGEPGLANGDRPGLMLGVAASAAATA